MFAEHFVNEWLMKWQFNQTNQTKPTNQKLDYEKSDFFDSPSMLLFNCGGRNLYTTSYQQRKRCSSLLPWRDRQASAMHLPHL
ncbi:MAG: hypothetical protein EBZ77_10285 [Chitinophagia bacterium]|nr:hypothetical protein [Chitinophagia bacterium]